MLDYGITAQVGPKSGGPQMEQGTFASAPAQGDNYQPGEYIHVSTRWDRPVKVDTGNPPYALIFMDSSPDGVRAEYDQASAEVQGNEWVMFSYQVQAGDEGDGDDDQLWLGNGANGINSLGNAASITDYSGNSAIDTWSPGSISGYGITTSGGAPVVSSAGFVFQYQGGQPVVEQLQPGEMLEYRIRFDRPVRVDQSALPYVNIGINSRGPVRAYYDAQRTAAFHNPSVLAFTYTVQDGDTDNDRVRVGDNNLKNAASISDYAGETTTGGGLGVSLGHNVGDSGAPTIVDLEFTSRPLYGGRYQPGETIKITVTASEPLIVDGSNPPQLQLGLQTSSPRPRAQYDVIGSQLAGVNKMVFTWVVVDGYQDDDGIFIDRDYLDNTNGVKDWSHNATSDRLPETYGNDPRHRVGDMGAPLITDVSVTSFPATSNTYSSGETIEITLTASEPLTIPSGQEPRLVVEVGSNYPSFRYDRERSQAAGQNKLVFTWRVRDGYRDNDGVLILLDSLRNFAGVRDGSGNVINADMHKYWHFYYQRVDARPKPARPHSLTASPGNGEVMLSWSTPGDESITKYRFRGDGSGRGWQDVPGSDAGTTSHTVTGLTNGQTYTFQVRAVNQVGPGPASDWVTATPQFLVTISVSDSTPAIGQRITLTANVASGIAVTSYQWDRKFGDGTWREDGPPRKSKGVKFDVNRTAVYRAVVTLSTGQTVRSEPVTLTWGNR